MVIRASAGSGKTFALSSRYLKLLRLGAQPDEILATTFTRKAAGEILGRVLLRLAEAASSEAGAAALERDLGAGRVDLALAQGLLLRLREHIGALAISTLDSFFHRMAGCFRFELGLPRQPMIVAESHPVVRQLRREAIDAMLGDEAPEVLIGLLRRLHHDAAQRRVTDAIDEVVGTLYPVYRQTAESAWHQLAAPPTLEREQVIDAVGLLRDAEGELPDARFAKAWRGDLVAAERGDWEGFLCGGLASKIGGGVETYYKKEIPAGLVAAYRPLIVHARASIVKRVAEQTEATYGLLARFDAHYARLRREHAVLLFSDLPLMLVRRVGAGSGGDPTLRSRTRSESAWEEETLPGMEALYYRLDSRVQHLLLDEFQDTSPLQWRVLRPFAEEIRAGEGSLVRDGAPARSFFCVGDVKQAIYGWRDGCAEVFDQVLEDLHLPAGIVQERSESRRTAQVVLDVVNEVFGSVADSPPLVELREHAERWACGFRRHTAYDRAKPGYVRIDASPETGEGEDARAAHLDFVVERVAELAVAHPSRTIGVLVRTNATAASLLHKLRTLGLAASGEGGAPLTSDPAVETLLSVLTLADHPGHTAAAHAVRHSPLGEVLFGRAGGERASAAAREASERGDGHATTPASHPDAFSEGERGPERTATEVARGVRRALLDHGYAGAITRWAEHLSGHCNARSVERLVQLIELAEQYDAVATLRARDFVRFVEATTVEDPSPAAVRVMTVHKAKGLEFDAVVLTELGGLIGQTGRTTLWQYRPTPTAESVAVYRSVRKELRPIVAEHQPNIVEAYEQEVGRRVGDDLSSLYVAMTRPRHALHVVLEPLTRTKSGWGSPGLSNACAASVLRHALTDVSDPRPAGLLMERGEAGWDDRAGVAPGVAPAVESPPISDPAPVEVRLRGGAARRGWGVVSPSRLVEGPTVRAGELVSLRGRVARERGTDVHDELAGVGWLDEVDESALSEPVRQALARPAVRELFERPAAGDGAELWRERAFAVRLGGRLLRGRFDRVVLTNDGATVIDFKTDRAGGRLREIVDHYRPQMAAYRGAVARMRGIPEERVAVKLAFVNEGVVVDA